VTKKASASSALEEDQFSEPVGEDQVNEVVDETLST
jgi:hypothetical protein